MTTAILGGRLIDGSGADPVENGCVLIENGKIIAAGPQNAIRIPNGTSILDAAGRTILPGFIDTHVHSTYRARDMRSHLLNAPTYNVLKSIQIIRETLAAGITTVRDMGGADVGFRQAVADGVIEGPRMLVSIGMITQSGGHGDTWVPADMYIEKRAWLPRMVADGVDSMRRVVRETLMRGADFIKICATGGITSASDNWDEPQFTVEEIAAAVYEAEAKHRMVAAHAYCVEGIRNALNGGVHSLEHGWFIDEGCIDQMLRQGTWWVPTLALVPRGLEERKKNAAWASQQLSKEDLKEAAIYERMVANIPVWKEAVRRGVKIAMGTDQSHRLLVGENMVDLRFMVEWLGMTPMQAIVSSTSKAAECIRRPQLGTLKPGFVADVLVVDGDPLSDISIMEDRDRLKLIMKEGNSFKDTLGI
jgi:imidazolonepropionase-like amidohydrolase